MAKRGGEKMTPSEWKVWKMFMDDDENIRMEEKHVSG